MADLLTQQDYLDAFRYLAGPPISEDDLQTLANVASVAPGRLRSEPELIQRLAAIVLEVIDRRRFPWISEQREPTDEERKAAVLASAAIKACQSVQTWRRNAAKAEQEQQTKEILRRAGFEEVPGRTVNTIEDAPGAGEFCGEQMFGKRRADVIVGLWDNRRLLVECKVSNSEVNSVKRLNNDAAAKAEGWRTDFGPRNVVPAAMLAGVYKLENLLDAQQRGLTLFWAHRPTPLSDWLQQLRDEA